jgi:hypothetical protein
MKSKIVILAVLFLLTGVSAAEVEVSTQQDWNQGDFTGTSADRNDNSGNLGLGYRNGTSSDSLIGYWRLDRSISGSGGTVLDYSGDGNDGTAKNGLKAGESGIFSTKTYEFDGNGEYINFPTIDWTPTEFSLSFWIYPVSRSDWNQQIKASSGWEGFTFHTGKNGEVWVGSEGADGCCDSRFNDNDLPADTLKLNQWTHFVFTFNNGEASFYKNGELLVSKDNMDMPEPWKGFQIGTPETNSVNGSVDEVRLYNTRVSSNKVEELYLNGRNDKFNGTYSRNFNRDRDTDWEKLEADTSSIPTDTDVDAVFKSKDSSDNLTSQQVIELQEGKKNYSLDVTDSEKAEIVFNGSSSDVTESWVIDGFKVYAGFCDYRGPRNECIMNSTRQLKPQTYDVDSIFKARSTAVFEAFSGTSILNISNSSRLSGTWRGSFDIQSRPVTIEPGARFKPKRGRIIIGK